MTDSISLKLAPYAQQCKIWPKDGMHFIAHQPGEGVITLYQAYNHSIATVAVKEQSLAACPGFSLNRMTWAKPGFLWMMYRSDWATKPNQEHILAVHVKSDWLFAAIKKNAVLSKKGKAKHSDIVIQWDPDHKWNGAKEERRAVQIGMRGRVAQEFAIGVLGPAVVRIEDITPFVEEMRERVVSAGAEAVAQHLLIPVEDVLELDEEMSAILYEK